MLHQDGPPEVTSEVEPINSGKPSGTLRERLKFNSDLGPHTQNSGPRWVSASKSSWRRILSGAWTLPTSFHLGSPTSWAASRAPAIAPSICSSRPSRPKPSGTRWVGLDGTGAQEWPRAPGAQRPPQGCRGPWVGGALCTSARAITRGPASRPSSQSPASNCEGGQTSTLCTEHGRVDN